MKFKKSNILILVSSLSIIINIFFAKIIFVDSTLTPMPENRLLYHTTKVALEDFNKCFSDIQSKLDSNDALTHYELKTSIDKIATASTFLSNLDAIDISLKNNIDFTYAYLDKLSNYLDEGFNLPSEDIKTLESFISLNNKLLPSEFVNNDYTINYNYYNNLILGPDTNYNDESFNIRKLNIDPKLSNYLNSLSKLSSDAIKDVDSRMRNLANN